MIFALVIHHAVRIVHPMAGRREMKLRPVRFLIEVVESLMATAAVTFSVVAVFVLLQPMLSKAKEAHKIVMVDLIFIIVV